MDNAKKLANAMFFAGCVVTGVIVAVCAGYILAVVILLVSS